MTASAQTTETDHLITPQELDNLVEAAERFRHKGVGAYQEIYEEKGKDVASALLLFYMSEKFGGLRQAAAMLRRTRVFAEAA